MAEETKGFFQVFNSFTFLHTSVLGSLCWCICQGFEELIPCANRVSVCTFVQRGELLLVVLGAVAGRREKKPLLRSGVVARSGCSGGRRSASFAATCYMEPALASIHKHLNFDTFPIAFFSEIEEIY